MDSFFKSIIKAKHEENSGGKNRANTIEQKYSIEPLQSENSSEDQKDQKEKIFTPILNLLNLSKKPSLIGLNPPSKN